MQTLIPVMHLFLHAYALFVSMHAFIERHLHETVTSCLPSHRPSLSLSRMLVCISCCAVLMHLLPKKNCSGCFCSYLLHPEHMVILLGIVQSRKAEIQERKLHVPLVDRSVSAPVELLLHFSSRGERESCDALGCRGVCFA